MKEVGKTSKWTNILKMFTTAGFCQQRTSLTFRNGKRWLYEPLKWINSSSHFLTGLLLYAETLACIGSQSRSPFDTRGCLSVSCPACAPLMPFVPFCRGTSSSFLC
ncbi:uncharacterized protein LOC144006459 [Festucalex cinctus]